VIYIGAGVALMIAGAVMLLAPGPGTLVLLLGAGLVAQESVWMSRALDWAELRVRALIRWIVRFWMSSMLGKVALLFAGISSAGAVALLTYRMIIDW
jgi:hypothetical protein